MMKKFFAILVFAFSINTMNVMAIGQGGAGEPDAPKSSSTEMSIGQGGAGEPDAPYTTDVMSIGQGGAGEPDAPNSSPDVMPIGQGGAGEPDAPYTVSTITENGSGQAFMTLSSTYLVEDVIATESVSSSEEAQYSVTIYRSVILEFPEDVYNYITQNIDLETYDNLVFELDEIVNYAIDNEVSIILIFKQ